MDTSTIAAIATPAGAGGISIIKISGVRSISIGSTLFRSRATHPQVGTAEDRFQSHRLYYGHIVDPENGSTLDEVLLAVMKAPHSYTCEDVVEINSHGSPAAVQAILELVLRSGACLAEPGEFTRRAFLNGRIDLTQAEAVIDIINARSARALEISSAQLEGALSREIQNLRGICLDLLARLEAEIDFPEDMDEIVNGEAMSRGLRERVVEPIRRLLNLYTAARAIRDGLTIAIVGRPNVGKSSLMNRLLCRERAIVTQFPGTTRDAIEDILMISGVPISVWDTAGLQETGDPVESIGIQKTWERIEQADVILFVIEAHLPLSEDDSRIFSTIRSRPVICVCNKIDLLEDGMPETELPSDWQPVRCVAVSALKGSGLEELRQAIIQSAWSGVGITGADKIMPNLRQKLVLERCAEAVTAAAGCLENGSGAEIVTIHLKETVGFLDEVLGVRVQTDILETIFSRFCIGK
jgi:tRNA modification GTPase